MPIFRVSYEVEFYAVGESAEDFDFDADQYAAEAIRDGGGGLMNAVEVKELDRVPPEWRDSRPYGADEDDRTIRQIMTAEPVEPEPVKDTWTRDMFRPDGE